MVSLGHPEKASPAIEAFPPSQIDPSATIAVFHTSGTSGFPKGARAFQPCASGLRACFSVLAGLFLGQQRSCADCAAVFSHHGSQHRSAGMMAGVRGCFLDHFDVAGGPR